MDIAGRGRAGTDHRRPSRPCADGRIPRRGAGRCRYPPRDSPRLPARIGVALADVRDRLVAHFARCGRRDIRRAWRRLATRPRRAILPGAWALCAEVLGPCAVATQCRGRVGYTLGRLHQARLLDRAPLSSEGWLAGSSYLASAARRERGEPNDRRVGKGGTVSRWGDRPSSTRLPIHEFHTDGYDVSLFRRARVATPATGRSPPQVTAAPTVRGVWRAHPLRGAVGRRLVRHDDRD